MINCEPEHFRATEIALNKVFDRTLQPRFCGDSGRLTAVQAKNEGVLNNSAWSSYLKEYKGVQVRPRVGDQITEEQIFDQLLTRLSNIEGLLTTKKEKQICLASTRKLFLASTG